MRTKLLGTVAGLLLMAGSSTASLAACDIANKDVEGEISKVEGIRSGEYGALRRDVRELRSAAMVLDKYGKDDACQSVVTAMTDLLRDPKASVSAMSTKTQSTETTAQTNETGTTETASGTDTQAPMTMEDRRKSSVSFAERKEAMSASELIGSDIYGTNNESIGEIEDIIVTKTNEPAYALVSYGGFLGMGESFAAVPVGKLMISPDRYVFADLSDEQLRSAPTIERGSSDWWANEDWRKKNDAFYQ